MTACILVSPFAVSPDSLPAGTHFVSDKVKLAPLSDQHKLGIIDYLDVIQEEVLSKQVRGKPAFIIPYGEIPYYKPIKDEKERNSTALQFHRFSLEYFAQSTTPMVAFSFDGTKVTSHCVDGDGLRFRENDAVDLNNQAWEKQVAYLKFAYPLMQKSPAADVIIGRICRAVREGSTTDGIIDIAIALEALVDAKMEIKFQFALYNSLISTSEAAARAEKFKLLQALYDVRSLTVHGAKPSDSEKKKIKNIQENWDTILSMARDNLTYYIEYNRSNSVSEWPAHIRGLAFGNPRITAGDAT